VVGDIRSQSIDALRCAFPRQDIRRENLSETTSSDPDVTIEDSATQRHKPIPPARTGDEDDEILAQPEFQGLWDQKHKNYKVTSFTCVMCKSYGVLVKIF